MEKFLKKVNELKLVLSTWAFVISAIVGAYNITTEYFVTKAYAKELEAKISKDVMELRQQTLTNSRMILEMQMIRLENKKANGKELTPTEERQYEFLKKEMEKYYK